LGARTRRAHARRTAVGEWNADRSAAAARPLSNARSRRRFAQRPAARAPRGARCRTHNAAGSADAPGRSQERGRRVTPREKVKNAVTALFVCGSAACLHRPTPNPNVLIIGVTSGPNNLDPRVGTADVSAKAAQVIFNNLMTLDDHLRVVPDLAER